LNTSTVVIGLVLIVIGVLFGWLFCLGGILVVVGLIVMIVGLVQSEEPKTVVQYYGMPPQTGMYPGIYVTGPPGSVNFCPYCGMQLPSGAVSCMRCGRPVPAPPPPQQ